MFPYFAKEKLYPITRPSQTFKNKRQGFYDYSKHANIKSAISTWFKIGVAMDC
jgi:hypothetical protein